jgi:hypothetical protein
MDSTIEQPAGAEQSAETTKQLPLKEYLDLYRLYRGYVMEESGLINARLMWIITINGFLFGTYGFTLQKEIETTRAVVIDSPAGPPSIVFFNTMTQTELFLLTICIVGFFIGILGSLSISAAQMASHAVEDMFNSPSMEAHAFKREGEHMVGYVTKDGHVLPPIRGGGVMISVVYGHRASWWIPFLLTTSWALLLIILIIVWSDNSAIFGNIIAEFVSWR